MPESHRLSDLQVGETRHHGGGMFFRLIEEPLLQLSREAPDLVDRLAQPQTQIGCDLIVARAGGVQALAGLPDESDQPPLDIDVDILGRERPAKPSRFDFAGDPGKAGLDRFEIRRRQDPNGAEHARMRKGRPDVLGREAPVKTDRGGVAPDEFGYRFGEPPRPEFLAGFGLRCHGCL